ncbi:DUF6070 family protein [Anaerostipes sp.]|uniref:DUF6070 family protein n=1 Tax=Anaerostipes sp. TaxID=1872530 RepID=UPI0025BE9219|nr:DUF6070 family protein [Anaerostipes sp.]MBS7009672.1 flagellar biosynthesis protein FlgE [Anaerostipes sp.]
MKRTICLLILICSFCILSACGKKETEKNKTIETELLKAAGSYQDIYKTAEKGRGINAVLPEKEVHRIVDRLGRKGYAAACMENDCNMQNMQKINRGLKRAEKGKEEHTVFYCVTSSGGLHRYEMKFRNKKMKLTDAYLDWDKKQKPCVSYVDFKTAAKWEYTKKGWLIWETVPTENEEMDTHCMVRVLPLSGECRRLGREYISPVGYRGNNLFLADWDRKDYKNLYLNDLYEYFYYMKHHRYFQDDNDVNRIAAEKFEAVLQDYLPFTKQEIRKAADYSESDRAYLWEPLRCWNLTPQSMPVPEVVKAVHRKGGITVLTVDALLRQKGTDQAFTHQVVLKKQGDGRVRFIKNTVISENRDKLPVYEKRNRKHRPEL